MNSLELAYETMIAGVMVFAIWYTMRPGEIFGALGDWFDRVLPEQIKSPVFECPVCMFPYYGTPIYLFLINFDRLGTGSFTVIEIVTVVVFGIGFNAILNFLIQFLIESKKQIDENNDDKGDAAETSKRSGL